MYQSPTRITELRNVLKKGPPVDVLAAARALGLAVYQTNLSEKNISGALVRNDMLEGYNLLPETRQSLFANPTGWTILVNDKEGGQRQRFTVAHEIGHYVLHRHLSEVADGKLEDNQWYRSELSNQYEIEANRFAAELLMPQEHLEADCNNYSLPGLADKYNVSTQAMEIRLGLLKLSSVKDPF